MATGPRAIPDCLFSSEDPTHDRLYVRVAGQPIVGPAQQIRTAPLTSRSSPHCPTAQTNPQTCNRLGQHAQKVQPEANCSARLRAVAA